MVVSEPLRAEGYIQLYALHGRRRSEHARLQTRTSESEEEGDAPEKKGPEA